MNPATPPDPSAAADTAGIAIAAGLWRGFLAFLLTALAGQLVGLAEWIAGARAYGARLPIKLGWLYLVSFHRVGIRITSPTPLVLGDGSSAPAGPSVATLRVAVLSGTILAGVLLFRAGRSGAGRSGPAAFAAAVALGYAVPIFLGSQVITLRFPDAGITSVEPVAWESLVFPLAFALAVVGAGLASTIVLHGAPARAVRLIGTGWRMFAAAVLLAFVGFIVLAGVRPDASSAYGRWLTRNGRLGALVATHHALLLPDQSLWILSPAMGTCVSLSSGSSQPTTLCGRTLTVRPGIGDLVLGSRPSMQLESPFQLFVLAPGIAVVGVAARSRRSGRWGSRITDGIAAGVVFAAFVWIAAAASRISVEAASGALITAGPEPAKTGLLALAWGIVGGAIGAALPRARPQDGEGAPDEEVAPAPPSPTSV